PTALPTTPPSNTLTSPQSFALYHFNANMPREAVFDRGNLVLDNFAPFVDAAPPGNPYTTVPTFDPSDNDVPRLPGIPLAANVLNVFEARDAQFGGLTRATPGRLQLNTGPV